MLTDMVNPSQKHCRYDLALDAKVRPAGHEGVKTTANENLKMPRCSKFPFLKIDKPTEIWHYGATNT